MSIAAVPAYLQKHEHAQASPALRFGMLLPIWSRQFEKQKDDRKDWEFVCKLNDSDRGLMTALAARQSALAGRMLDAGQIMTFEAVSTAPFTTGLGNEHPLENGFAFLDPYGLPYLPGSGVKGVVRQAARELASGLWGQTQGWSDEAIEILFGSEDSDNPRRGALVFHDVIPEVPNQKLMVEIMTPHQQHYYQNGEPPHDSSTPNPIKFLTLPPDTRFRFLVGASPRMLGQDHPDLAADEAWKPLLQAAFEHAFEWLGFGAKTAVGYGAMRALGAEEIERARAEAAAEASRCQWIDETIARIAENSHSNAEEALRGKALAQAWSQLDDPALKERALADIRSRWEARGWWEAPPGKAAKKARAVYQGES